MRDEQDSAVAVPTIPGTGFAGGFYAGRIRIDDNVFALVVAPKFNGEHPDTKWNGSTKHVAGAGSFFDGLANTNAMAAAGSKLALWARAIRIDAFDDWYLPSRDELELLYRHFKPTSEENYVHRSGDNPSSVPAGYPYSETVPALTSAAAFREGGPQMFDTSWYWSSTQYAGAAECAWFQTFHHGSQSYDRKSGELRARAVRRVLI